jgi:methylation protein EvaC
LLHTTSFSNSYIFDFDELIHAAGLPRPFDVPIQRAHIRGRGLMACLICGAPCKDVIDFGMMPIAGRFLEADEFASERRYPLAAVMCTSCSMVQLAAPVDPDELFHDEYAFFSSTSRRMSAHFQQLARDAHAQCTNADPFIVEIGSNDGILLKHLAAAGVRHLGIEPSANVAVAARDNGVQTIARFFDDDCAADIEREYGAADVIIGANVMCHIPALRSVVRGFERLLASDGVVIMEDPYLGDIIEKASFDQIYDEHVFYFSLRSIRSLFEPFGFEVVEALPQHVHGGSMRYVIARAGTRPVSMSVAALAAREGALALDQPDAFSSFRMRVSEKREQLRSLLTELRSQGKRVVGYAATAKSATAINYFGLTLEDIEYISDTTPLKQGRLSPGAHIPVVPHEQFAADAPDYALLFAWNHQDEILANETGFSARGGQFITYVPEVAVLRDTALRKAQ